MRTIRSFAALSLLLIVVICSVRAQAPSGSDPAAGGSGRAEFEWFEYSGNDKVFEEKIGKDEYRNPIIAGFYPDPSIVRVGEDYYLVNSTFGFYPGLPIFHSRDLVNWEQIGNAIDRPDMVNLDGVHLSGQGLYAPTIRHHNGTFYIANTCVNCGGNFIVTAKDPAGPWSYPSWLPEVGGIDPSLYFEGNRLFIVNNDIPEGGPQYEGHRAIWIRELDPVALKPISKPLMLVNGGVRLEDKPIWIEGPHIYKIAGTYYLSAAEGGTERNHSQVIFRSDKLTGPYVPWDKNPILTQRDLPPERENPVNSTGHADLFSDTQSRWWAVFLATRTYDGYDFNTGRETFLLPVKWKDGWPTILDPKVPVPYVGKRPPGDHSEHGAIPTTGNFKVREKFRDAELDPYWTFVRIPRSRWWQIEKRTLSILARNERMGDSKQPSIIARRIQHMNMSATAPVRFDPKSRADEAGLIAFQSDEFYYAFGIGQDADGNKVVRLRRRDGKDDPARGNVIAEQRLETASGNAAVLRITVNGPVADFEYSADGKVFRTLVKGADARTLSSLKAGGFVGAMVGMYAEGGN
jgi:xylan 1,4-beta-xylosidase